MILELDHYFTRVQRWKKWRRHFSTAKWLKLAGRKSKFWTETLKMWKNATPIAFNILCQHGTNLISNLFVRHLGDIELSSVTISLADIGTFSLGFMVSSFCFVALGLSFKLFSVFWVFCFILVRLHCKRCYLCIVDLYNHVYLDVAFVLFLWKSICFKINLPEHNIIQCNQHTVCK